MLEALVSIAAVAVLAIMPFALLAGVARLLGIDSWGPITDDRPR